MHTRRFVVLSRRLTPSRGTGFRYRASSYAAAAERYSRAVMLARGAVSTGSGGMNSDARNALAVLLANRAACHHEGADYDNVIKDCTEALALDAGYARAALRRARARLALGDASRARHEYSEVGASMKKGNLTSILSTPRCAHVMFLRVLLPRTVHPCDA